MLRLHFKPHGMILLSFGLLIASLSGISGAPLTTQPSTNTSADLLTSTEPSYEQYGGLVPGTDEYNKAYNKKPKESRHSQPESRMAQSDHRQDIAADSPKDEQVTSPDPIRHSNGEKSENSDNKRREERRKRKNRNKNKDRSDDDDGDSSDGCSQRSDMELKEMLGPAFNGRYMSVERPAEGDSQTVITEQPEETAGGPMADDSGSSQFRTLPFHVGSNYRRELPPDFYLDIAWYQEVIKNLPESAARLLRRIRSVFSSPSSSEPKSLPWQCESEIIWTDLGANYYPRFLRNVRCTRDNCWFGHFKCRPKAFTVNVLKRVRDSCKDGLDGQEWVYEERAVTFCCECVEY